MDHDEIDDRWLRLVGIPLLGFTIPPLTGMLAPWTPLDPRWWAGGLYFTALAFAIWHTHLRVVAWYRRWSIASGGTRLAVLLATVTLFTLPWITGGTLLWMLWRGPGLELDTPTMFVVIVITTVCAVTITHIYETGYLIKARARDALHVERLEHARAQAQLDALRSYIDPHFLFNNLNTLSHLIADDPDRALAFNDSLAEVYRYILCNRGRDLVLLREEIAFLRQYYLLLRLRFGPALELDCDGLSDLDRLLIPPISLQVLVENAVKHNSFDRERPLELALWVEQDTVIFRNPRRPKVLDRPSTGMGLHNLDERYRHTMARPIAIEAGSTDFTVKLPLLRVAR
jgi:hypothetical protein